MDQLFFDEMLMLQQRAEEEKELADEWLNRSKKDLQTANLHFSRYVQYSAGAGAIQKEHSQ